jgi:TRAP-type C4-dicarboxylate transport system permease small subunit
MQLFLNMTKKCSKVLFSVGGGILVVVVLLVVVDVILRYLRMTIAGTYELVSYAGALVAGLAIAQTSIEGGHVSVDTIPEAMSPQRRDILRIFTKLIGLGMFALLTWSFFLKGYALYKTGEVSLTLNVPYYPLAYVLSVCSFVEFLVLLSDILKTVFGGGEDE